MQRHAESVNRVKWQSLYAAVRACRPHQWSKNVLLVVPAVVGHRILDPAMAMDLVLGFIVFSATASAIYIINDLFDLEADRMHPTKRNRPLASGALRPAAGAWLAGALLIGGLGLGALALPGMFVLAVIVYLVLTTAYTFLLKSKLLVDVIALAALYTLRVLAGGWPFGIPVSFWLLAFSMFFFLSLAFVKRYSELQGLPANSGHRPAGRGYRAQDLDIVRVVGPGSGYMAVMVFAFYIHSDDVALLYNRPEALWFICPIILYWITRVWFLAHRNELPDDPVVFALKDKNSYAAGVVAVALLMAAVAL